LLPAINLVADDEKLTLTLPENWLEIIRWGRDDRTGMPVAELCALGAGSEVIR
jgi:hypothetical protein